MDNEHVILSNFAGITVECPDFVEEEVHWSLIENTGIGSITLRFQFQRATAGRQLVPLDLTLNTTNGTIVTVDDSRCQIVLRSPVAVGIDIMTMFMDQRGYKYLVGALRVSAELGTISELIDANALQIHNNETENREELVPVESDEINSSPNNPTV